MNTLTIKSRWQDRPWVPEPGSILGTYSYTLDGVTHTITEREVRAAERMGRQSHRDYGATCEQPTTPRGGWELFDLRPGATGEKPADDLGNTRWTASQDAKLCRLYMNGTGLTELAEMMHRSERACVTRLRRLV